MILSIIIPVFNSEKYVRHTLESIFHQNFDRTNAEIIVINDGTQDNSMDIVREFAAHETSLKIIEQENQGLSAARNTGIKTATGKYIWFVDSDDWIEDRFLEKIIPQLNDCNDDVLLFRIREHNETSQKVVLERHLLSDSEKRHTDFLELLQNKIDFTPMQLYIIRKEFMDVNHLKFVRGIVHEDMEFAPKMLVQAQSITTIPLFHYNYLWRESGSLTSSSTNRNKRIDSLFKIIDLHKALQTNTSKIRDIYALEKIQFWLYRKLFNYINKDEYIEREDVFQKRFCEMKSLVRKNLFYKATSMMIIHRLIFLVSPRWLKLREKGF